MSPLLANLCLDMLDEWVSRQWERKETRYPYKLRKIKYSALRESTQLMPGYIVRYADDFVIVTDTREHAQSWKTRICEFLSKRMRLFIGVTDLTFVRWQVTGKKNQAETPYAEEGRNLYFQRTKKKRQNDRLDSMYNPRSMEQISRDKWGKHFDFEFYMNRAYALNRDRLKCRVCGGWLIACTPYAHRIDPHLPQNKVNKVGNLASMHKECMEAVNNLNADLSRFDSKARRKIAAFREKLDNSHVKTIAKMERRVR